MSQPDEQIAIDLYKPSAVQAEAHACRTGDFTEILYGGTAGCGKRLHVDTPIPTPSGWTTMGSIKPDDYVLGADGIPARVLFTSPIETATDCYRVVFSDGSELVADAEHLWKTSDYTERERAAHLTPEWRASRRARRAKRGTGKRPDLAAMNTAREWDHKSPPGGSVRTTAEIRDSLMFHGKTNHSVAVCAPLQLSRKDLPLDPYVLGAWLGDGSGNVGIVTGDDPEVFESIRRAGFEVHLPPSAKREWRVSGLTTVLRSMGLLSERKSARKRIPPEYLRASVEQRLALLQGLMDTDGHCSASTGQSEFTTTNANLRDGMAELLSSLGIKTQAHEGVARLYGRDIGPKWRLLFFSSMPAFRIRRKLTRQKMGGFKGGMCKKRYIVSVEPHPPCQMRCIAIDSPSRLYLAGRTMIPTHNTLFLWWDPIITQVFREHERFIEYRRQGIDWRSKGWHIHFRRTYKMLKETIACVGDIIRRVDPGARWNGDDHVWTFTCGYRYEFGHLENEDDWRAYDSRNLSSASHDEVIQTMRPQYMGIYGRIRCGDTELNHNLRITSASNPDAPAEGVWVRERFVDPAPMGRKLLVEKVKTFDGQVKERSRIFFPATLHDNPNVDVRETYEVTLRQLPHHVMLARLMGDWNVIEGAFFAWEWKPEHHVVRPFPIPEHWTRFRCIDWGYKRACPVYHVAVDPDNNLIVYRETTYNHELKDEKYRKDAELVALAIREEEMKCGEWDEQRDISAITGPDDPKMRANTGTVGPSMLETMESHGVYWDTGSKDIDAAVAELVRRLRDIPSDRKQRPGIVFFATCREFINRIGTIPTDKGNPEMPEHGGVHHWLDAILCGCMYRPAKSAHNPAKKPMGHPDIDVDDEVTQARMRRRRSLGGFRHFAR